MRTIIVILAVLLSACGSSGPNDSIEPMLDDDPNTQTPDDVPEIVAGNARNVSIAVLELLDVNVFAARSLVDNVIALAQGQSDCATTGTVTVELMNDERSVRFIDCDFFVNDISVLNGELHILESSVESDLSQTSSRLRYTDFSTARDGRTVRLDGILENSISFDGNFSVSSEGFVVQDNNGSINLSRLLLSGGRLVSDAMAIEFTGSFQRFAATLSVAGSNLVGGTAACPASGELTVTSNDGSTVSIETTGSDNITMRFGSIIDTINCAEVASVREVVGPAVVPGITAPPGIPDNSSEG